MALEIAAKHWQHGIIYTNGIKKVPVHVPFRIAISIWGAKDSNERLRGAASYGQALQTAKEDQRALIVLTINRQNIDDIPEIAEDCVEQGVKLSFNDFSTTSEYARILDQGGATTNPFVRQSKDDNPS